MSEFKKYVENEFFIIDSNNLNTIKTELYGFMVDGDKIIMNDNVHEISSATGNGTYVYISKNEDLIQIFQDYNGSYGLYFYQNDDYFAISNSFLKLIEYLKDTQYLTFNEDYASYFLTSDICSIVYKSTLINEIEVLPRNYVPLINIKNKNITFKEIDYEEHSVELDSKEGLFILDNWFYKWVNIIRTLKLETNNIQVDLTGGFDSRIVLTLLLSANVNLNKIEIRSFNDDYAGHKEDFIIANKIAKKFNFKLNNPVISAKKINFKDIHTPLQISAFINLGFNNEINYKFFKTKEPVYNFSGYAGETVGSLFWGKYSPEDWENHYSNRAKKFFAFELEPGTKRIIRKSFKDLENDLDVAHEDVTDNFYQETRCRTHYGKMSVEQYVSNKIVFSPLLDPEIHKLKLKTKDCDGDYLLMALIFIRYCPKLLEIEFDDDRKIEETTIDFAKKINNIAPLVKEDVPIISGPQKDHVNIEKYYKYQKESRKWEEDGEYLKIKDIDNYLINIFKSNQFKKEFGKYYPLKLHDFKLKLISEKGFHTTSLSSTFSILYLKELVKFSRYHNNPLFTNWLKVYNQDNEIILSKIKESQLFDEEYYLSQLTEEIDIDPLTHYLEIGYKEGKNPSLKFDNNYYLNNNNDVFKAGVNPLLHYVTYGKRENRPIMSVKEVINSE